LPERKGKSEKSKKRMVISDLDLGIWEMEWQDSQVSQKERRKRTQTFQPIL
jgi:hypothetical protein